MTKTLASLKQLFALVLTGLLLGGALSTPAYAELIDTTQLAQAAELQGQRAEVQALLARADVAEALLGYGVSADDVEKRVQALSDSEVRALHGKLQDLPAGQEFLGVVIGLVVLFMLLDMAGVTDIFPRI